MRGIKFRGKLVSSEWVAGNLSILSRQYRNILPGSYISNSGGSPFAYRVLPDTVGQYTGLKDKNDVEIYEGDIVCVFEVYVHEVIFQDGAFGYITNDDFIPFGHNCYFNWINGKSDDIEVVGNVHDDK